MSTITGAARGSTGRRLTSLAVGVCAVLAVIVATVSPASAAIDSVSDPTPESGDTITVTFTVPTGTTPGITAASLAVCAQSGPGTRCDNQPGHFIDLTGVVPGKQYQWDIEVDDDFFAHDFTTGVTDFGDLVPCDGTGFVSYYNTAGGPPMFVTFDGEDITFV